VAEHAVSSLPRVSPTAAATATVVLTLAVAALLPVDATTPDLAHRLAPPSPTHLLGTDQLGRDVLARLAAGVRWTVGLALLAVTISTVVGTSAGILAGYTGGPAAGVLLRVIDLLVALPAVLFGLVLAAILGPGPTALLTAVLVAGWTPFEPSWVRERPGFRPPRPVGR
jgi:peptide/nickel transport system permease protein